METGPVRETLAREALAMLNGRGCPHTGLFFSNTEHAISFNPVQT